MPVFYPCNGQGLSFFLVATDRAGTNTVTTCYTGKPLSTAFGGLWTTAQNFIGYTGQIGNQAGQWMSKRKIYIYT